ncbi:hypothetical protein L1887_34407 [Cichorium endivia]|nr:hypothetical protein L1887_34407 [Cichorium endivia]
MLTTNKQQKSQCVGRSFGFHTHLIYSFRIFLLYAALKLFNIHQLNAFTATTTGLASQSLYFAFCSFLCFELIHVVSKQNSIHNQSS